MTKSVEKNALAFINLNSPEESIADFDNQDERNE